MHRFSIRALAVLAWVGSLSATAVLAQSQVWVNGDVADGGDPVGPSDEVAVLPPISGG